MVPKIKRVLYFVSDICCRVIIYKALKRVLYFGVLYKLVAIFHSHFSFVDAL